MNGHGHDLGHVFVSESVSEADSDTDIWFLGLRTRVSAQLCTTAWQNRLSYDEIFSYTFQGARCGEFNGSRYCQALRQMDNHKPHHARRIILNHVKVSWFHLEAPLVPLIQARRLKRNLSPGDYTLFSVTRELTLILRQNRGWIYYKKN